MEAPRARRRHRARHRLTRVPGRVVRRQRVGPDGLFAVRSGAAHGYVGARVGGATVLAGQTGTPSVRVGEIDLRPLDGCTWGRLVS